MPSFDDESRLDARSLTVGKENPMSMTVTGTVMPNSAHYVMQPTGESGPEGLLKFMFSAPGDQLTFSIGPGSNPGGPGAYAVTVGAGAAMLAIVDASIFKNNVLAVLAESSTAPVPFAVTIE